MSTDLQKLLELRDDVGRCALSFASTYVHRRFDDITKFVSQIILAAHGPTIHRDTRANGGRRDRKNGQYHPFWTGICLRETKECEVRVQHLLEDGVYLGCCDEALIRLHRFGLLHLQGSAVYSLSKKPQRTSSSSFCFLYWTKSFRPSFLICGCTWPHPPWPFFTSASSPSSPSSFGSSASQTVLVLQCAHTTAIRALGSLTCRILSAKLGSDLRLAINSAKYGK